MDGHTQSFWEKTAQAASRPAFAAFAGETKTDVLVVGGGITGVSTAWRLAKLGVRVMLIEAGMLGCGATGRSTGKVSLLHGAFYGKMADKTAAQVARTQAEAVNTVRDFAQQSEADCGYAESDACLFARDEKERQAVEDEYEAVRKAGFDARLLDRPEFPPACVCAAKVRAQALIHPLHYLWALAAKAEASGAALYEHTRAVKVRPGKTVEVLCENGARIEARHLVEATQYPFFDDGGLFFARLYPRRSYGVAVQPQGDWPMGNFVTAGDPVRSLRTARQDGEKVLLVVGDGHDTGRDGKEEAPDAHFEALARYAGEAAGPFSLLAQWSAQDYDTPDGIPYIGPVHAQSNIYVATGYGKWGLASGTLAGIVLTDWVTEGASSRGAPYDPARLRPAGAAGMAAELVSQAGAFVRSKQKKPLRAEDLAPGEGSVVLYDNKKAGAYRGPDGRLTVLDITCTHLGCTLTWNGAEQSWDCPCHGGRFSATGERLEGPPPRPLRIWEQAPGGPPEGSVPPDSPAPRG